MVVLLFASTCAGATAASPAFHLTLNTVFGARPPWGFLPSRIAWAPNGRTFAYVLPGQDPKAVLPVYLYEVASRRSRVLIDPARFGKNARTPSSLVWSPNGKSLAYLERGTLYVRDLAAGTDRKVAERARDPQWSPLGNAVAYVHAADLYVAHLGRTLRITRVTHGGVANAILNGELDWVYPEELGTPHGYAWSPNGKAIAYLRMDERGVTEFPIVDFLPYDNTVSYQRYPLAGENNPRVTLRVVDLRTGASRLLYDAGAKDEYLPFFGWKPNSKDLLAELLDRSQKHLRVVEWDDLSRPPQSIYAQSDAKWLDDVPLPTWLPNGSSLWVLDRGGTFGLYERAPRGALRRLTGAYRTFNLLGTDSRSRVAYVTAAYPTRRDRSLLAVPLHGGPVEDLTPAKGTHRVWLAPGAATFVDTHSTVNQPPQADLVNLRDGRVLATLAAKSAALQAALLPVRMLEIPSAYGPLDAWMLVPPRFDPHRRYPVIVYVYGGPAAPTTADGFGYQFALYHQLLARRGFIVFSIDGPASQVNSDAHVRMLYHNFGPGSLLGQVIGVRYLDSLSYVDAKRIGIWGWSFGGYETAYALTHTTLFRAGAAVAPVTDWHLYDTIYTERYMGRPQDDPRAYDESSVLTAAKNLHGALLISHGTSDNNVHMANSIALLQQFVLADKENVDFMVYPRTLHPIAGLAQHRQLFGHMLTWWVEHL